MNTNCIQRSRLRLLPHQQTIVEWLNDHRGIIAVHNTGSGKTLAAVTASQCFLDNNPTGRVIVIAPVSLLPNFQKEMVAYGGLDPKDSRYSFFSYEKFMNNPVSTKMQCRNNLLIVDEAHELRTQAPGELSSDESEVNQTYRNRAQKIVHCAMFAKRVLLLTATPYINASYDFANLLAMVKGTEPLTVEEWDRMVKSQARLEQYFSNAFHYYAVPKTRANKYPTVRLYQTELEMDWNFLAEYLKVEQNHERALRNYDLQASPAFLVKFRKALLQIPDSAKVNFTMEKILEVRRQSRGKVVVYSNFIKAGIQQIGSLLTAQNIPYGEITGSMSAKDRQRVINAYNANEIHILLISKAAQRGIDLKETTCMIILDVPWNMASLEQAIGRVARYESHIRLPDSLQQVDVHVLYNVKPIGLLNRIRKWLGWSLQTGDEERPSVDQIMKAVIERKSKESDIFMNTIKRLSIRTRERSRSRSGTAQQPIVLRSRSRSRSRSGTARRPIQID